MRFSLGFPAMVAAILAFMLLCTGCWNRREPELLGIISTLGFDYDPESGFYELTVDVVNSALLGGGDPRGGGGGGRGQLPFQVFSARGRTFFEALRKMEAISSRELLWAHAEVFIVSERLARRSLAPVLDLLSRERQSRLFSYILITDEAVRRLMEIQLPLEQSTGGGLARQITSIELSHSVIPDYVLRDVFTILSRPGFEAFIPRIRMAPPEQWQGQQQGQQQQQGQAVEIKGGATFRGERLAGWLGEGASRGWVLTQGRVFRGTIVIPCPDDGCDGHIAIEVFRSSSRIEPVIKDGKPSVKLQIKVLGRVQDHSVRHPLSGDREIARDLNNRLATAIRHDVEAAIRQARRQRSDIFGFGNLFYRKMPREWEKLKDDWAEHFKEIEVEIEVNARVSRVGLVFDTVKTQ